MRATITVRNIDTKLFKKQRMALFRTLATITYNTDCRPRKLVKSDINLLEGLVNMTDNMADTIDGVIK
jgi:hypothetical protein